MVQPALGDFEWREAPVSDEDALSLLEGSSGGLSCVEVYWEWRKLGATVMASLIRAGETAREAAEGSPVKDDG